MSGRTHKSIRRRHRRDAGFTLLELLVGLTVLAMLVALIPGALRIANRAWTTSQALVSETESASALLFVEQHLAGAMPLIETSEEGANSIAFEGGAQSLRFVATLENGPLGGGLYKMELAAPSGVAPSDAALKSSQLVLRLFAFSRVRSSEQTAAPIEDRTLLSGLESARFRYFGAQALRRDPEWSETWTSPDRLPDLVELTIVPRGAPSAAPQTIRVELRLRTRT